jgi:hypothetical protein
MQLSVASGPKTCLDSHCCRSLERFLYTELLSVEVCNLYARGAESHVPFSVFFANSRVVV